MSFLVLATLATLANAKAPDAILSRNIFCSGCGERVAPPRLATGLELVATMRCPSDERWSVAVIVSPRARTTGLYARGARVDGAEVLAIGARQVILRVGDHDERLTLDEPRAPPGAPVTPAAVPSPAGVACTSGRCTVERTELERWLADPSQLARWARVLPAPGGGLALYAVHPGSPLAALGLASGDRIRAINHVALTTVEQMLQLYRDLRHASQLSVEIVRAGATRTIDVAIR